MLDQNMTDLPDKISNHLSLVSKDVETTIWFVGANLESSVRCQYRCCQHDLSVEIWSHVSVVSKDVMIKTSFVSANLELDLSAVGREIEIKNVVCQQKISNQLWVISKDVEIKMWSISNKFGEICQLLVRMLSSKHDFLIKIRSHQSMISSLQFLHFIK